MNGAPLLSTMMNSNVLISHPTRFAGNVPAGGMGFKWGRARTRRASSGPDESYAMNIRAAEAIVSNAPKAMKIFPISEV